MQDTSRILVIIPAYNEAANIFQVAATVKNAGYDYIIVNDGSTDDTLSICRKHDLNVLDLSVNLGIGGAVQAGHRYAQLYNYDIDIQFDGDGQHDITYIAALVNGVESGADLVIGSRFLDVHSSEFKSTFLRRIGINWLSTLIQLISHQRITDPTSGFRACNKRAINLFCQSYPTDYPEPESIVDAARLGLQISEVPVSMNERQGGASSIGRLSSVYYMIKVTLAILITGLFKKGR